MLLRFFPKGEGEFPEVCSKALLVLYIRVLETCINLTLIQLGELKK